MASIHKTGPGKYEIRWRYRSRQRSYQVSALRTAQRLLPDIVDAIERGIDWSPLQLSASPELEPLFRSFLAEQRRWLPSTLVTVDGALVNYVRFLRRGHPRGVLASDLLSAENLYGFIGYLQEKRPNPNGRQARRTFRCNERTAILTACRVLAVWTWLYDQPAYQASVPVPPRRLDVRVPAVQRAEDAPTWADMDAVIGACSEDWHYRFFLLGRFTGLRASQVMRLEWRDVDLDHARLTLRPELGKSAQERCGRVIPISPHLVEDLRAWGPGTGFLVAPARIARSAPQWVTLRRRWTNAGVDPRKWRDAPAHALRKGFISCLNQEGAEYHQAVKALVGHSRGVTGDVYDPVFRLAEELVARIPAVTPVAPVLVSQRGRWSDARRRKNWQKVAYKLMFRSAKARSARAAK